MEVYKKLFEAKKEIGKISKDSKNPFYKSKYFDINQLLEHVEPILQKHNLLIIQPIIDNCVHSIIIDIDNEDSNVKSSLELTNQTDPQKRGSEITYYRRYTLASLLGLQAEDDDANKTVNATITSTSNRTQTKVKDSEKPWLNKFTNKEHTEVTKEWKRAILTLQSGKDIKYLRNYFKISRAVEELLEDDVNTPA